jgi:hypothetical protein
MGGREGGGGGGGGGGEGLLEQCITATAQPSNSIEFSRPRSCCSVALAKTDGEERASRETKEGL